MKILMFMLAFALIPIGKGAYVVVNESGQVIGSCVTGPTGAIVCK